MNSCHSSSISVCGTCGSTFQAKTFEGPLSPVPDLVQTNHRDTLPESHLPSEEIGQEHTRLRGALCRFCNNHEQPLSLVQRLPFEILSMIFYFYSYEPQLLTYPTSQYRHMLLTQICQHWRRICLSLPQLWSTIDLPLSNRGCLQSNVMLAQTWLARAANLPLRLHLGRRDVSRFQDNLQPIIDVLIPHSTKWQSAVFMLPVSAIESLSSVRNQLPNLEFLSLTMEAGSLKRSFHAFEFTPKLRSLCIGPGFPFSHLVVPWAQLTGIEMAACQTNLRLCLETLDQCPKLISCSLDPMNSELAVPHPRVELPNLHYMNIWANSDPGTLFDHLLLPRLVNFRLTHDGLVWPQSQFISLLSRSACHLTNLVLYSRRSIFRDNDFIRCLELIPTLVELSLTGRASKCLTEKSLSHLSFSPDGLVPKLLILRISCCTSLNAHAFVSMVTSRTLQNIVNSLAPQNVPLQNLHVHNSDLVDPAFGRQLLELRCEGIEVVLVE